MAAADGGRAGVGGFGLQRGGQKTVALPVSALASRWLGGASLVSRASRKVEKVSSGR